MRRFAKRGCQHVAENALHWWNRDLSQFGRIDGGDLDALPLHLHSRLMETLVRLENTIAERRGAASSESYVAQINARGLPVMARKLGEEAVETAIAALAGTREELVGESADLLFHLLVLLAAKDIRLSDVLAELDRREGVSGLAEKAARSE